MTSSSRTSEVDFGIVRNDESLSDAELLARMHAIEEQREELEKKRRREELKKDPDAIAKQYRASHFFCGKTIIPLKDEAEIIKHQSECSKCLSREAEKVEAKTAYKEGISSIRYILGMIERAKEEIATQNRKITRERAEQKDNFEFVVEMAQRKIKEAENVIKREEKELDKLLKHHPNTITRDAAQQVYDTQYLNLSDKDRKRVHLYDETL